jgi:hypothetical protein
MVRVASNESKRSALVEGSTRMFRLLHVLDAPFFWRSFGAMLTFSPSYASRAMARPIDCGHGTHVNARWISADEAPFFVVHEQDSDPIFERS